MGLSATKRSTRAALAGGLFGLLAASGTVVSAAANTSDELHLGFGDATWGYVGDQQIVNEGTNAADVTLVAVHNPSPMFRSSYGGGLSLQFPSYSGTTQGSYAALRVKPEGTDWLSPGTSSFSFGADLRLNELNEGSSVDNGNNVIQRGLWDDPMQFKLEVDNQRPSCVIRGSDGRVSVTSKVSVVADKWYRVRCERSAETITISVLKLGSGVSPTLTRNTGSIGRLKADLQTPLSVGAKLHSDGEIVRSATDQFNGRIDNVFFAIG